MCERRKGRGNNETMKGWEILLEGRESWRERAVVHVTKDHDLQKKKYK